MTNSSNIGLIFPLYTVYRSVERMNMQQYGNHAHKGKVGYIKKMITVFISNS